jgi:ribosomal protein L37AE/L43A
MDDSKIQDDFELEEKPRDKKFCQKCGEPLTQAEIDIKLDECWKCFEEYVREVWE